MEITNFIELFWIKRLKSNLQMNNSFIQVVLGPRQVGKTTGVLKMLQDDWENNSIYVSADLVFNSNAEWLIENWKLAEQKKLLLVIDEIQKCFNWAETLKKLYDESKYNNSQIRCIVLGSSSLEIQKGLTESLTGRFQLTTAFHWNYSESHQLTNMDFSSYLKFGGYPGSYSMISQEKENDAWYDYVKNSIIATVVEKDILQFHNVKKPALFRQIFDILCSYPAQEISYTKLLGQLQDKGNIDIIQHYLKLYEGAFLFKALQKFSNKPFKTKSSSPKIIPLAPCLYYSTIRADYESDEKGRAFELAVGCQLVRTGEDLFYWRDGKYEVDYVVKIGKRIWAIEVKTGDSKSAKGLVEFKKHFPQAHLVFINEDNYFEFEQSPIQFLEKMA